MIYFSPSAADGRGAFFDDALFGPRVIEVLDETRQEAALNRARTKDLADFHKAQQQALIDNDSGNEPTIAPVEMAFQRRQREVEANPIMKTVANPCCRLPADAVNIEPEQHAELMRLQAEGHEIVANDAGFPIAIARERSAEEYVAAVRKLRDRALVASDWTELPSNAARLSAAKKQAWADHRRRLRDLPATLEKVVKDRVIFDDGSDIADLLPPAPK